MIARAIEFQLIRPSKGQSNPIQLVGPDSSARATWTL